MGDILASGNFIAAVYDLYIQQGTSWQNDFTLVGASGLVIDLTGYTGNAQIRTIASSPTILANLNVAITVPISGMFSLSLIASGTSQLPAAGQNYLYTSAYAYDVELVGSGGNVVRVLNGVVNVSPEVTR